MAENVIKIYGAESKYYETEEECQKYHPQCKVTIFDAIKNGSIYLAAINYRLIPISLEPWRNSIIPIAEAIYERYYNQNIDFHMFILAAGEWNKEMILDEWNKIKDKAAAIEYDSKTLLEHMYSNFNSEIKLLENILKHQGEKTFG